MKHLFYNILFIACALLCFACGAEDDPAALGGKGYLRLSVGQSNELTTKADEEYKFDRIQVEIKDSEDKVVKSTTDFEADWKDTKIELAAGEYTIEARSYGWDGEAGEDKAYYEGSEKVTVESGKDASAEVKCYLANVKVTVAFEQAFLDALGTGSMSVQIQNKSDNATYVAKDFKAQAGKQVCYFAATDLDIHYTVTNADSETNKATKKLRDVKPKTHYIVTFKLPQQGQSDFTVTVDGTMTQYNCTITVDPNDASAALLSANPWAKFAYLKAESVNAGGVDISTLKFQYRVKDTEAWTDATATKETVEGADIYTGKATKLEPSTTYEYRLVNTDASFESSGEFTTEEAKELYNGNFDNWHPNGNIWYAIAPEDATSFDNSESKFLNSFWDSGNPGAAMIGADSQPTMPVKDTDAYGGKGQSAKLTSMYKGFGSMGKFAAGNIYTGHYCETIMEILAQKFGARLRFGHEFTSRPTQLKGVYKYSRGTTIDYGSDEYKSKLESTGGDLCSVYIALTDNEGLKDNASMEPAAFEIDNNLTADEPENFKYKSTIDFSEKNPHIIAYGELSENEAKGAADWTPFTIDLKYRDLTRVPKYIIVVASASKYGDYFTGSTSSVMYIDDFELVYGDEPKVKE